MEINEEEAAMILAYIRQNSSDIYGQVIEVTDSEYKKIRDKIFVAFPQLAKTHSYLSEEAQSKILKSDTLVVGQKYKVWYPYSVDAKGYQKLDTFTGQKKDGHRYAAFKHQYQDYDGNWCWMACVFEDELGVIQIDSNRFNRC